MDLASGKIELSERCIKKLNCGHTLQTHLAVVLIKRNNGKGMSSVTATFVFVCFITVVSWREIA